MKQYLAKAVGIFYIGFFCSCAPAEKPKTPQQTGQRTVIPFVLSPYNNIIIKTLLNGTDSLNLKYDSGTTGLLLTHKAIREKTTLLNDGKEAVPTQNYVKLSALATLQIEELLWEDLSIYPVQNSGQGTAGRFGWDLFKDKIVCIDYDTNEMIICDQLPDLQGYTKATLTKTKTVLCIDGKLTVNGKPYPGRFLVDTGYQKSLLLDSLLMAEQAFPKDLPLLKTNQLKNGAGEVFVTEVVELPELTIGGQTLKNIPTQLLNKANPTGFSTHILGNELLKRFNTVIDVNQGHIYFKPNSLINAPYSDAKTL